MAAPGIADIEIYRVAIAVEFPMARDGNRTPGRIVIAGGLEALQACLEIGIEIKFPIAGKVQGFLLFRSKSSVHREPAPFHYGRILPIVGRKGRQQGEYSGQ